MALTNAEKQASGRERHLKNENGTKLRLSSFSSQHHGTQLKRIACHRVAR
jgi:hypothetical protein